LVAIPLPNGLMVTHRSHARVDVPVLVVHNMNNIQITINLLLSVTLYLMYVFLFSLQCACYLYKMIHLTSTIFNIMLHA
jgi:hypothetical protein